MVFAVQDIVRSLSNQHKNIFVSREDDHWSQMQDKLIDEDPLGHVKFGHLFKEYCVKFACNYDEARYQI